MKAKDLRQKDDDALRREVRELCEARFKLGMQGRSQQTKHPHRFRRLRRDLARAKTVLRERLNEAGEAQGETG